MCWIHFQTQLKMSTVCAHCRSCHCRQIACTEPYNKLCYAKERMTVLTTNCPAGWIACFNFTCSQNINQNAQRLELGEGICKKACLICPGKTDYCLTQEDSWTNSVPSSAHCWKHSPVNIQQKGYLLHFCCLLQQSWRQLCQTWLLCHRDGISQIRPHPRRSAFNWRVIIC